MAPGHPQTPMIPVHGGVFGNNTEASLGQIIEAAFGADAVEAIKATIKPKQDEITKKRADEAKKLADAEAAKDKELAALAASVTNPGSFPRHVAGDGTVMEYRENQWVKAKS